MLKANYTPPQHPRTKAHRHHGVCRAVAANIPPSPVVPCHRVVRLLIIYVLKSPSPCVCDRRTRRDPYRRSFICDRRFAPRRQSNVDTSRSRNERRRTYTRRNRYVRTHTPIYTRKYIQRHTYVQYNSHTYIYIYRLKLISSTLLR